MVRSGPRAHSTGMLRRRPSRPVVGRMDGQDAGVARRAPHLRLRALDARRRRVASQTHQMLAGLGRGPCCAGSRAGARARASVRPTSACQAWCGVDRARCVACGLVPYVTDSKRRLSAYHPVSKPGPSDSSSRCRLVAPSLPDVRRSGGITRGADNASTPRRLPLTGARCGHFMSLTLCHRDSGHAWRVDLTSLTLRLVHFALCAPQPCVRVHIWTRVPSRESTCAAVADTLWHRHCGIATLDTRAEST